jgi:type II secretory pathway component GspD/PulD (secretin)
MILLLGYTSEVRSEPADYDEENMSEIIGKQDPFKMVTPIADAKKRLFEKMIGSQEDVTEQAPDLFVETVMLKFLRASNLERVVANLTSGYGAVSSDVETNSLIVCDTQEKLKRIIQEIRKADQTPRQIMVEVVIADVQLTDETEIGVNWTDLLANSTVANNVGVPGMPANIHNLGGSQDLIAFTGGGALRFVRESIGVTLQALQQVRNVEILASPRVLVVSGQEAYIKTVEEIPYTEASDTSQGGSLTSTEFKEAGITLTVKATITDDDKILITIEPEQSVNTGTNTVTNSTVPVVDTRSAKTTLLMNDGQVVVMGGLRKKETRISNDKIPLLGDLPLIGFLFSDDKTETKHTELLVFISPHIYNDDAPLSDEESARFRELLDAPSLKFKQEKKHGRNPLGITDWPEDAYW